MRDFKLSAKFLADFDGKQPDWGYGALSYVTYKRTYAREIEGEDRTEEFWETLKRRRGRIYNSEAALSANDTVLG